ncbi:MAG: hypothetical protein AAF594_18465 [Bacteroidota bacterium]
MRSLLLVSSLFAIAGCDALGISSVGHGVVTRITVDRLDLERRWDGDLFSRNPPDVYVDVKSESQSGYFSASPVYRSLVTNDIEAGQLPLTVRPRDGDVRIALDDPMWINVSDRDGTLDDLMVTSGPFRLGDVYGGEEAGEHKTVRFEGDAGAIRVTVRWD